MSRRTVVLPDALLELIDHRGKTAKKLGGDWSESGHRVVSAINIKRSRVDANDHHYVSNELYTKWMKVPLRAGDVLLTSEAPTGEVAYLAEDRDWCLGQRVFGLRTDTKQLLGRYLYYQLRGGDARHQLLSRATGTTVSGIRQSQLVKVRLDLPPLPEQRGIAATLGALDDKIDSNRRAIDLAIALLDAISERIRDGMPSTALGDLATAVRTTVTPAALGDAQVDLFSLPAFDADVWPERVGAHTIMSNKLTVGGLSILVSRLNPRINRTWWASRPMERQHSRPPSSAASQPPCRRPRRTLARSA